MKEKIAKLLSLVAVLSLMLLMPLKSGAEYDGYGYYIDNYHTDVVLYENNTAMVTENISVVFNSHRQGIYRIIPTFTKINKPINGVDKEMRYNIKISDVKVNTNYDYYTQDGYLYIKIGTEGVYQYGPVDYTISYFMDMGDDRIEQYDDVFFSVIGADWDCPINSADFSFTYPSNVDEDKIQLFSGQYGSLQNQKAEYSYDSASKTLSGHTTQPLQPYEAITVYTMLDEGYFKGESTVSMLPVYVAGALCLGLLLVLGLLYKATSKRRDVVPVVSFYPPENFTSAQVGYIIDGITSDKEVLSLIIWMASKGYVIINQKSEDSMSITKNPQKNASDLPSHVKPLYDDLFENGRGDVNIDKINLYGALSAVKQIVPMDFTGSRKLFNVSWAVFGVLASIFSLVFASFAIGFCGAGLYDLPVAAAAIVAALGIINCIMSNVLSVKWAFLSDTSKNITAGISFIMSVGAGFATYMLCQQESLIFPLIPAVLGFAAVFAMFVGAHCHSYTDYYLSTVGQLLGLKEFIKQAELDRIRQLVNENPSYFFDVLPFAYVFGLTDKWIKNFEAIDVTPESRYFGGYDGWGYYRMHWLYHSLDAMKDHSAPPVNLNSGSGGNFNSGGFGGSGFGGGFSGGGFGGGGGRSW